MGGIGRPALFFALAAIGFYWLLNIRFVSDPSTLPGTEDVIFGKSDVSDEKIRTFSVQFPESQLEDLRTRLEMWKKPAPTLQNVKDNSYGINLSVLEKIVDYWKNSYDWKYELARINKMPHHKTIIQGLDIHFIHTVGDRNARFKVPLLLLHGWPGSVLEFYKVIPKLVEARDGLAFDIVCPSIPGYGFSEIPVKPGFSVVSVADIFHKLMMRLGYDKYVVQGGDWGSIIGGVIAHKYHDHIIGYHTNFHVPSVATGMDLLHVAGVLIAPSLVVDKEDVGKLTFNTFKWWMEETGYMHEQMTKPDTVGIALSDSPVGLAGYVIEKFIGWSDGFPFSNDELITNVMLYWLTNTSTSSLRLYKYVYQLSSILILFYLELVGKAFGLLQHCIQANHTLLLQQQLHATLKKC